MRSPGGIARNRASSSRVAGVAVAAILLTLLVSVRGIAGLYTDYLWFAEIGQTDVWRGLLLAKLAMGGLFTAVFFGFMWTNLTVAERIAPSIRPAGPEEQIVERFHQLVGNRTGLVRFTVSLVLAALGGTGVAAQWHSWLLLRNGVPFGRSDPQFGWDIGFFVFQLPFISFVLDWLFVMLTIVLIVTAMSHYLNGGIRLQSPIERVAPKVKVHLSVLMAVLALLKAGSYFLDRFELLFAERGVANIADGAGYTDVAARLPAFELLAIISVVAFFMFLFNITRRGWALPAMAVGLWAVVAVVVGVAIPAAVERFQVLPTQETKESEFIQRNLDATRNSYQLNVESVDFKATDTLAPEELADSESTIRNLRLWDPAVIGANYQQSQAIRGFYQFNDVDVDRYEIDGRITQMLVSARELKPESVPSSSWVNQRLAYTHGYGAVATPSSGVTKEGNPAFRLQDVPPVGRPALNRQPALYFGQGLDGYAVVGTNQKEIDYPKSSEENQTTSYTGKGGVELNSLLRRAALALRFGDLNILISDLVRPESRAIYFRDIDERVVRVAPFLRFDSDPYPVVVAGGVKWVMDAYTVSNRYPYAQRAEVGRLPFNSGIRGQYNYIRNSVKVVIDAYDGEMTFYVVDDEDPLIKTYAKAFPKLFTPGASIPKEISDHFRHPEDLFRIQSDLFGRYHTKDSVAFYSRADAWDVAQEPGDAGSPVVAPVDPDPSRASVSAVRNDRMDPYYLLMTLPDEEREEFLFLQPFVPFSADSSRRDLSSFLVAKADGTLKAYVMPRDRPIPAPARINGVINQDLEVSREKTLLSDAGSTVVLGNLLLIPVGESLLYIQPLYVAAEKSAPQLKQVIVVAGGRVVMRATLRDALTVLFGSSPPTLEEAIGAQGGTEPPPVPRPDVDAPVVPTSDLIAEAELRFTNAEAALRRGDLAGYQRETEAARALVRRLADASRSAPPAAPPTTMMRAAV